MRTEKVRRVFTGEATEKTMQTLKHLLLPAWKWIAATVAAICIGCWNQTPEGVRVVITAAGVMFACDTVAGFMVAWKRGEISGEGFGKCFRKFLIYALSLITATAVDAALHELIGMQNAVIAAIGTLIFIRETLSFMDHSTVLGFRWPRWLANKLEIIRERCVEAGIESCEQEGGENGDE